MYTEQDLQFFIRIELMFPLRAKVNDIRLLFRRADLTESSHASRRAILLLLLRSATCAYLRVHPVPHPLNSPFPFDLSHDFIS